MKFKAINQGYRKHPIKISPDSVNRTEYIMVRGEEEVLLTRKDSGLLEDLATLM